MEQKIVYAITWQDRPGAIDVDVMGVFDDKGDAKILAERLGGSVYACLLNPDTDLLDLLKRGYKPYRVKLDSHGTLFDTEEIGGFDRPGLRSDDFVFQAFAYTTMMARDEAHAVEIARERERCARQDGKWPSLPDEGS